VHRRVAWVVALVGLASPAHAAPPRRSETPDCSTTFRTAREREQSGHLREAATLLADCARASCGSALRRECASDYTRLDAEDIPSIVPTFTDAAGAEREDVRLSMDGEVLATRLDGRPVPVDPGLHEFSFEAGGGVVTRLRLLIVEGQRNRAVVVTMPAEAQASPSPHAARDEEATAIALRAAALPKGENRPRAASIATGLAVAGAAGVAAGALLPFLDAKDRWSVPLEVSVGAGVAAVVVTLWTIATGRPEAQRPSAFAVDVRRTPSGAQLTASHAF